MIAELAKRQHGVVGRRQLLDLGLGLGQIEGRIARGRLHIVFRGAYAVGHAGVSRDGRVIAAVLASGDRALASHRSAGELWRLTPPFHGFVEVTVPSERRSIRGVRSHASLVPADERGFIDGIAVTSPPRTLLDLASVLGERRLERAFREMEVRRLTDRLSLPELIERYPGRRGVVALRRILASRAPVGITLNEFEERFVAFLIAHRLPGGRMNASIWVRGRFYEPDCLWERQRLMVELDGREVHGTDRSYESDRSRDRVLLAEGWRTMRVTWKHLRDEPGEIATDLRLALGLA